MGRRTEIIRKDEDFEEKLHTAIISYLLRETDTKITVRGSEEYMRIEGTNLL